MLFFKKMIKYNCPHCGKLIKFPEREVHLEQTKKGTNIILPANIQCKKCKKESKLPTIEIDNSGKINFDG